MDDDFTYIGGTIKFEYHLWWGLRSSCATEVLTLDLLPLGY